jgi:CBS domain-containing protein/sporulation protein YlmC with PRC-barrel domain
MLYFSRLKGKQVKTEGGKHLGKLVDVLFLASSTPLITKLVVKSPTKEEILIPADALKKVNHTLILKDEFSISEPSNGDLSLIKNLLDQQIIDVQGHKVVRVNDVTIQDNEGDNPSFYISGVDIGFRGILRWINLEEAALPIYRALRWDTHPHFLSWGEIQPLELARGNVQLKKGLDNLDRIRPEELADYLEKTNIRNVNKIVSQLDEEYAAEVIGDLNTSYQTALFRRFSPEKSAELIGLIDADEAVDILLTLPHEKRDEILASLPKKKQGELHNLLKLSKTPIGELITSEFFAIEINHTVGDVIELIKERKEEVSYLPYIYITNDENELVGVVNIHDLFVHSHETSIRDIMEQNLIVIHVTTPKDIAVKKMLRYKVYALPVTDNAKHLEGVVRFDDLAERVLQKYD